MSKIVLGRGLEALIPTRGQDDHRTGELVNVAVDRIAPNPFQPRKAFDADGLKELAESIRTRGLLQPILVKKDGAGYTLVAGERRFRAAKLAGVTQVPAMILEQLDESDMLQIALIENLQREDLNPLETAGAYQALMDKCGLNQAQVAERVGKSRAAVANTLRLLTLPEHIKQYVAEGKLNEGHARAILSIPDPAMRDRIAQRILTETLSVRQAEGMARQIHRRRLTVKRKAPDIEEAETFLKHTLGTAVKIMPGLKKGAIQIEYYGNEDLNRLLDLFRKIS
ncbi:MAG: ParB/RepB/Spo0J family partition protein [candidate division Zixibacteria bacterium]|nr:ParB/RepB/Spo0J family partition protein [candidate division Zixibacteria bacterium]